MTKYAFSGLRSGLQDQDDKPADSIVENPFEELPDDPVIDLGMGQETKPNSTVEVKPADKKESQPSGISDELVIRGDLPSRGHVTEGELNDLVNSDETENKTIQQQTAAQEGSSFSISDIHPGVWIGLGVIGLLAVLWLMRNQLRMARRSSQKLTKNETLKPVTNKLRDTHNQNQAMNEIADHDLQNGSSGSDDFGAAIIDFSESAEHSSLEEDEDFVDFGLSETDVKKPQFELTAGGESSEENSNLFESSELNFSDEDFDFSSSTDDAGVTEVPSVAAAVPVSQANTGVEASAGDEPIAGTQNLNGFGDSKTQGADYYVAAELQSDTPSDLESKDSSTSFDNSIETPEVELDFSAAIAPLSAVAAAAPVVLDDSSDDDTPDLFDGATKETALETEEADQANIQRIADLESSQNELSKQLETSHAERQNLIDMVDELKLELERVTTAEQDARQTNATYESELTALKEASVNRNEFVAAEKQIAEYESQLAEVNSNWQAKIEGMVERSELEEVQSEKIALTAKAKELQKELESRSTPEVDETALANAQKEIEQLRTQLTNSQAKIETASNQAAKIDSLQSKIDELTDVKQKLKKKLRSTLHRLEKFRQPNSKASGTAKLDPANEPG
jgi:hypothetical protein